ncbi:MAG: hypothetical protein HC831_00575 [Chloroflexia bacterium]|nr:hypothetical protein [Chloroflexia bacterium]
MLETNGFDLEVFEDHSQHLKTLWGQTIFEKGAKAFYCDLGVSPEQMKRIRCGYYLIVAKKKKIDNEVSPVFSWTAKMTDLKEDITPERLKNWQYEKLLELIQYASKHTKFYKDKLKVKRLFWNFLLLIRQILPMTLMHFLQFLKRK